MKDYQSSEQKDLVKKLEAEIKHEGIRNIECIWGDIERRGGTKLLDSSMDVVIVSNVLYQVEDKLGIIDEVKRVLRKGGKVLFVDWNGKAKGIGPTHQNVIDEEKAKELFEGRGFKFEESISTSEHHYGIIFKYE